MDRSTLADSRKQHICCVTRTMISRYLKVRLVPFTFSFTGSLTNMEVVTNVINWNTISSTYESYVLPLLQDHERVLAFGKKHKTSISFAVGLYGLYLGFKQISKPPKSIRHIPQINIWRFFGALMRNEPNHVISETLTLPASMNPHGMYVVSTRIF